MKNLFLGLAVVAVAFSASAFTNLDQNDFIVDLGDGGFTQVPSSEFDATNCIASVNRTCAYKILVDDPTIPANPTQAEVDALKTAGKIQVLLNPLTGLEYKAVYIP